MSDSKNSDSVGASTFNYPGLKKPQTPKHSGSGELEEFNRYLSDMTSSLRILEDKYYNLRKKMQLTEQTLLEAQKQFSKEKKILNDELMEAKLKIQDQTDEMDMMRRELKESVHQKDFKVLEKYLDMWDPMHFVTRKEVEKLLDESSITAKDSEDED